MTLCEQTVKISWTQSLYWHSTEVKLVDQSPVLYFHHAKTLIYLREARGDQQNAIADFFKANARQEGFTENWSFTHDRYILLEFLQDIFKHICD